MTETIAGPVSTPPENLSANLRTSAEVGRNPVQKRGYEEGRSRCVDIKYLSYNRLCKLQDSPELNVHQVRGARRGPNAASVRSMATRWATTSTASASEAKVLAQRAIWPRLLQIRAVGRVRSRSTAAAGAIHQRIVVALNETICIMAEIDEVIEAHGGWPDAFQTGSEAEAARRGAG